MTEPSALAEIPNVELAQLARALVAEIERRGNTMQRAREELEAFVQHGQELRSLAHRLGGGGHNDT